MGKCLGGISTSIGGCGWALLLLGAVGCSESTLPGHYWDVSLVGSVDTCNEPTVPYADEFSYRLTFDGGNVDLSMGEDLFASGFLPGTCELNYESVIWSEQRGVHEVKWMLRGEATIRLGGDACGLEAGLDWVGTETFEIMDSEDPDLSIGCEYQLSAEGVYAGELE